MDTLMRYLQIYKDNYARYRVTGDQSAKAIADSALHNASYIIKNQETIYERDKGYIQSYVKKFKEDKPRLIELHHRATELQKEVPAAQNEYAQTQEMNKAPAITQLDYEPYLIKGGIAAGLIIIAIVASFL